MGLWRIVVPEATTNLCTNPSFETNTTGWNAQGTNTIARNTAQQWRGLYSLLCTYQNDATLAEYALSGLSTSTVYYLSAWVFVPATWDGGNIRIQTLAYSGSSETYNNIYTDGTSPTAEWVYLETKLTLAADVAGSVIVETTSAPTAGRTVYLDAVQFEQKASYATTYCDGDEPGCEWTGAEHASTSTRDARSRDGGYVKDWDDYGVYVTGHSGMGAAPVVTNIREYPNLPGAVYEGYAIRSRPSMVTASVIGTSLADLHSKRNAFLKDLRPDYTSAPAPVLLRYTGADSNKVIEGKFIYEGGLDGGTKDGFTENIGLRLLSTEPMLRELGDSATVLNTSTSATYRLFGAIIDGVWDNLGPPSAVSAGPGGTTAGYGVVHDEVRGVTYCFGDFTNLDGIANADCIAYYDGSSWNAMGTGAAGERVEKAALDAGNNLYAAGRFTSMGGVTRSAYLAKWNGSAWSSMFSTSNPNSIIHAVVVGHDGYIYVGGNFTTINGVAANRVAYYNGSTWNAMGTGSAANVDDLAVAPNGDIWAVNNSGLDFGGVADTNGIAYWDGSAWNAAGTGDTSTSGVYTVAVALDGKVYVGGAFTDLSGVTGLDYLAFWNGTAWSALGASVNGAVNDIRISPDGLVYVIGDFTTAGGLTVDGIALWNGYTWAPIEFDFNPSTIFGQAVDFKKGNQYWALWATNGSLTTSHTTTVTNNGSASVWPKIVINRSGGTSATLRYLENTTTGTRFWFNNYAMADGETITIDLSNTGAPIVSSSHGNVLRAILRGSDLGTFRLLPGANVLRSYIAVAGGPTITAYVLHRNRHWSIDGVA